MMARVLLRTLVFSVLLFFLGNTQAWGMVCYGSSDLKEGNSEIRLSLQFCSNDVEVAQVAENGEDSVFWMSPDQNGKRFFLVKFNVNQNLLLEFKDRALLCGEAIFRFSISCDEEPYWMGQVRELYQATKQYLQFSFPENQSSQEP